MAFQVLRSHGATSSELAERLGVTKQAAGQIVDDLEKRGYVRRQPHPAGGRRKLVVLTDAAHQHLAVAGRILHDVEAEAARSTDQQDLAPLRTELANLIRALHPHTPSHPSARSGDPRGHAKRHTHRARAVPGEGTTGPRGRVTAGSTGWGDGPTGRVRAGSTGWGDGPRGRLASLTMAGWRALWGRGGEAYGAGGVRHGG
ncbi:MarR family winged helix-turn-helix transcriptional regulator [Streptomyces endophytica]|uniref:MarR family winged helix-turn-helix transcriptional regulator n=1 Tax=Streptomyces endophytica TaxID=2991496 RepID=A0ABY6PKD4_9ACTN|nr:MarR family winged helix-turn-helix transcriptional regulator [Streptomyces endophytica]UZJ34256.1 MarR family winged helix-turn-helix transcriptional regulator [Streptomyces endophytica]